MVRHIIHRQVTSSTNFLTIRYLVTQYITKCETFLIPSQDPKKITFLKQFRMLLSHDKGRRCDSFLKINTQLSFLKKKKYKHSTIILVFDSYDLILI